VSVKHQCSAENCQLFRERFVTKEILHYQQCQSFIDYESDAEMLRCSKKLEKSLTPVVLPEVINDIPEQFIIPVMAQ